MKEGDKEYMQKSKERLEENACKKIKTTMIGAIEAIENNFGPYLHGELKEVFQKTREEILNKGNKQIKNMSEEFKHYDINWKRFTMRIPMKRGN